MKVYVFLEQCCYEVSIVFYGMKVHIQ